MFASSLTGQERIKTDDELFLDYLKAGDRPTIQIYFHRDKFLGRFDDLVHQRLVLHRKPDGCGGMVPPGIGTVLIRSTHKTPATTAEQGIRWFHIEVGRRTAIRGPGARLTAVPVLNSEKQLSIGIVGPL